MKVVVFGSINMDLVVTTSRLPGRGETITGNEFFTAPGGKGANQAVAAARLGAATTMVGRVGDDPFAAPLLENLSRNGVQTEGVYQEAGAASGIAVIAVEESGENNIIIASGANRHVDGSDVTRLDGILAPGDILLLQLEVPLERVVAAARLGAARGATVILDPAPATPLPDELFRLVEIVTPNETEAEILTGIKVTDEATAVHAAHALHGRGARQVLIKMGAAGALWSTEKAQRVIPGFRVNAIDTVAAGDACNGGLAAGLAAGLPLPQALRWGMAAGALATTQRGAQEAMPDRETLLELLAS